MAKVSGTLGGQSIEGYVRSSRRRAHLCNPGQTVTLILDPSFPIDPQPADPIVLYENDTLVLTGYVQKVTLSKPSFDWMVEGMDTYQRAQSFFIEDPLIVGHDSITDQPIRNYTPQTTATWIAYLLNLCGASYDIQTTSYTVPQGVQLGLRTVHESLQDILAYSSQYVWANPSGVIEVRRATRNAETYHLTDFTHFEYRKDDEWTRTEIKVFGGLTGYGSRQQKIFASASTTLPNIIPNRIAAVATPMIQTYSEAQRVADYMISELGDVTWVATGTIEGNPNIHIGQSARLTYDDFDRVDVITSLETDWDENGYLMQVTIGERCPRISGWSRISAPLYVGTTTYGIYRSDDGGINWSAFNTGLPVGTKYVKKHAYNSLDEGMAIVNGSLYYSNGTEWTACSLPSPVNTAGDVPAPVYSTPVSVDSLGQGSFNVLTTNTLDQATSGSGAIRNRSWLFTCTNGGLLASDWESSAVYDGTDFNHYGVDLNNKNGVPIILTKSPSNVNQGYSPFGFSFQIGGSVQIMWGQGVPPVNMSVNQTQRSLANNEEYGVVPRSRRHSQISQLLEAYQSVGNPILDPDLDFLYVKVRLVLGADYPGTRPTSLYYNPFIATVIGEPGYNGEKSFPRGWTGQFLSNTILTQGWIDLTIFLSKPIMLAFNPLWGGTFHIMFYVGHAAYIGGKNSGQACLNMEPKRFDTVVVDPLPINYDPHYIGLPDDLVGYPVELSNMAVSW